MRERRSIRICCRLPKKLRFTQRLRRRWTSSTSRSGWLKELKGDLSTKSHQSDGGQIQSCFASNTFSRSMRRQTVLHADWYVDPCVRIVRPFWLIDDDVARMREYLICWKTIPPRHKCFHIILHDKSTQTILDDNQWRSSHRSMKRETF